MNKSIVTTAIIGLSLVGGAKAEENSPLTCRLLPGVVSCNVVADNFLLKNIVLNKGNCQTPVTTPEEKTEAQVYINRAKKAENYNGPFQGLQKIWG